MTRHHVASIAATNAGLAVAMTLGAWWIARALLPPRRWWW